MKKKSKSRATHYADDAPLTKAELRRARPAREVFPEIVEAYLNGTLRKRGERGPQKAPIKEATSIRLPKDVINFFKSQGPGWQTRINTLLQAHVDVMR